MIKTQHDQAVRALSAMIVDWHQRHVLAGWAAGLLIAAAYAYLMPKYEPAYPDRRHRDQRDQADAPRHRVLAAAAGARGRQCHGAPVGVPVGSLWSA
jgi:hypothetical protein